MSNPRNTSSDDITGSGNSSISGTVTTTTTAVISTGRRKKIFFVSLMLAIMVVMIVLQIQSESSSIHRISFGFRASASTAATAAEITAITIYNDSVPNLMECVDGCLYFGYPTGCYHSDGIPLRGSNRWTDEWKTVTNPNILSQLSLLSLTNQSDSSSSTSTSTNTTTTTIIDRSSIVVVLHIHTPDRNINHIFHDDFWSILSYFSHPHTLQYLNHVNHFNATGRYKYTPPTTTVNVTLVHDYSSPWLMSLVEVIAKAYPWWNIVEQLPTYNRWICTGTATAITNMDNSSDQNGSSTGSGDTVVVEQQQQQQQQQKLYISGYIRNMNYLQISHLPRIRSDLRTAAYREVTNRHLWSSMLLNQSETYNDNKTADTSKMKQKELIIIYTREDTGTRQIHDTEQIIAALDTDRYNLHVQRHMPRDFYEQVAMFGMADLLIAPNGGWTPNVLWMKDTACLVEIHLYDHNSWLLKYGLDQLFPASHIKTITGDYHNETINGPRLQIPNRHGGDDEIQGSMVVADIVSSLRSSPTCQRFLRTTAI